MSSVNPFVEDIESRQARRSRPSRWFASCVPPFCAFLFGTIGLIVFIYILVTLNPLGLDGNISGKRSLQLKPVEPYDVSRPIRRWPVNGNSKESVELEPYDVSRPIRRRPATVSSNGNSRSVGLEESSTTKQAITVSYWTTPTTDPTTDLSTSESVQPYVYVFNRNDPLNDIHYPNVPAPVLCIPRIVVNQEEFDEKQFYCYQCWQDVDNGTIQFSTSAKSEEEHRYKCHARCYDNYDFQSCAIHMYLAQYSSDSARNCTYCKQATREALGLGEHSSL